MNEKMNGGISTMRGIFCRLSFQKGGITAETIAAQGFDGGIFYVDTRQKASKTSVFDAFCCKNAEKGVGQNVGQLPDPHRDPHAELSR